MTDPSRFSIDIQLLDRYLAGSTTRAEDTQVLEWLAANPEHARIVEVFRTVPLDDASSIAGTASHAWMTRIEAEFGFEKEATKREVRPSHAVVQTASNISASTTHANNSRMKYTGEWRRPASGVRNRMSIAFLTAVITLVAVFGLWNYSTVGSGEQQREGVVPSAIYTTRNGARTNLTLPDGSSVVLSVGSRLEVPTDFGAKNRTLRLDGEGLFTVTHATGMPFIVKTGNTAARVLGTTFAVRSYATDSVATISIQQGKVAVGKTIVTANQQAVVSKNGTIRVGRTTPASFSFATGVLTLPEMPLSDAIVELNRWYDIDIRIGDSVLATQKIEGEFVAGSLSDFMSMLQWTFSLHVVRDGRVFTLYRRQS